jgi:hypothetical protein
MDKERLNETPEEAKNMERHYGFGEYRDLFQQNRIKTGDSIVTFSRLPSKQLLPCRYCAVDSETLKYSPESNLPLKARNTLKGIDWFLDSKN